MLDSGWKVTWLAVATTADGPGTSGKTYMPKVRSGAAEKWERRTSASTPDYLQGVQNPRADWATVTAAAAPVQAQAVQQAIADNRYAKGVQKAGTAKWQAKTIKKGGERFAGGVAAGQADYQAAVQPYLDVIANLTLPARGAVGDQKNYQRVIAIGQALRAKKLGSK